MRQHILLPFRSPQCATSAGLFQPVTSSPATPHPQVPTHIYDRSTAIFVTALAIDILNVVFERQTIKIDCVLLPA